MQDNLESSLETTKHVVNNLITNFKLEGDYHQMQASINPIISNAIFKRENELLEQERLKTFVALSRILDDENIYKAVKALKYKLTLKS